MAKVYKSKIGIELAIPLIIIFGGILLFSIFNSPKWYELIFIFSIIAFLTHMFSSTNYTIDNGILKIKCGFLFNQKIDVSSIRKISETNNLLSSPALSIDRLEIMYGKYEMVLISPKLKKEFIAEIISINPNIEVKYKKLKS